jgi:hypothetical protein
MALASRLRPPSAATSDLVILGLLALAKLAFHLITSHGYGIFRDELYYIACSEHLAFGYVDHPPLSILLLWLSRATLGDSLPAIRFLPAAAGAGAVFLSGVMARELGGRRPAQLLAALAVFFAPVLLALSHVFSMNAFDVLFWALLAYTAMRILARDEPRLWILFGLMAGLGLENKYSVAFFGLGLVVGLLLSAQRRQLASPWMWLGGALSLVLFLPHLIWQVELGWPSLEFIANARANKIVPVSPVEFLLGQIVLVHPLAFPIWVAGLGVLLFGERMERFRCLGWAYVATFALLTIQQAKVYYLSPAYPMLLAAGAVAIDEFFGRRRWRWGTPAAAGLVVVGGIALLPLTVPLLPVESFIAYSHAIGIQEPQMERNERGRLPQQYADMHGWDELVETVVRVYHGLPPEDRARVAILARSYGEAGAIDFLGKAHGLPGAISGHNSYYLWGPGDFSGEVLIVLGRAREDLSEWFEEVEQVDTVRCAYCMPHQNNVPVHLCRRLRVPVEEAWSLLKDFG